MIWDHWTKCSFFVTDRQTNRTFPLYIDIIIIVISSALSSNEVSIIKLSETKLCQYFQYSKYLQAPKTNYESVASDYEMFITANISTALNLDSPGHPDIIGNLACCGPRTFQVKCSLSIIQGYTCGSVFWVSSASARK